MEFIFKNIRRLKYYLALYKAKSHYSANIEFNIESEKHVVFDIQETDFHRYLYTLVLFYQRSEYIIFIIANQKNIARLSLDKYAKKLVVDPAITFLQELPNKKSKEVNLITLSANYFQTYNSNVFHIPMCQHPTMYDLHLDEIQFENKRINSMGFAGDFRTHLYSNPKLKSNFQHPNRIDMLQHVLKHTNNVEFLKTNANLEINEYKIYIADNASVRFSPLEYKKFLSNFHFFLALPGIHMPQCHNIIEAMSVGTIPFIHQAYANQMHPKLVHKKTAFIYDNFENLTALVNEAFKLENAVKSAMHKEVLKYYENHLSSTAVVKSIEAYPGNDYKLIAEWNGI